MLGLMQLKFRSGATPAETKAASIALQEGLENPSPGWKIINSWVDLGAGVVYTVVDITEGAAPRSEVLKRFLQFRVLPAVESTSFIPLVETKESLAVYLKM
jgi:hypothetical protein